MQKNEYEKETARLPKVEKIELHSESENYVENALELLGKTLQTLRDNRKWKNSTMLAHLSVDHFSRPEQFSRIINHEQSKRPPTAGQMFELRRVFGISLDAVADGGDPFEFEQMSDARLIELNELIATELTRRIWQR